MMEFENLRFVGTGRPGEVLIVGRPLLICDREPCMWTSESRVEEGNPGLMALLTTLVCPRCNQKPLRVNAQTIHVEVTH